MRKLILLTTPSTELLGYLILLLLRSFDLKLHLLNILVLHHEFLVFNGLLLLSSHFQLLQQSQLVLSLWSILRIQLQLLLLIGELLLLVFEFVDDDLLLLESHLHLLELQQHLLRIVSHLVLLLLLLLSQNLLLKLSLSSRGILLDIILTTKDGHVSHITLLLLKCICVRLLVSQGITAIQTIRSFLALNVFHNRTADFARRCFTLALANPVVGQHTPATLTVPSLTVLVTASLHVLPQRFHLGAEPGRTLGSQLALGSVSKQEETLLLLANDLLRISAAPTSAVTVRRAPLV
mmetsp:Transcript_6420/g.15585  ORF Transcript_6420/g.15585 Transcript_6420/m.15585 type:complete len:293 (-) Transcript_6420:2291-3169(-)